MTNFSQDNKKLSISEYCERIGSNPLLVQGAGGNISWKEGDVLWVKASGMWLIDATKENIFVSVDLKYIQQEVAKKKYSIDIQSIESSELHPSIETILHGILPHNVVLQVIICPFASPVCFWFGWPCFPLQFCRPLSLNLRQAVGILDLCVNRRVAASMHIVKSEVPLEDRIIGSSTIFYYIVFKDSA